MFKPSLKALLSFSLIFALVFVMTTPSSAAVAGKKETKKNADRQPLEKDQKPVPVKEKVEITVTAPRVEILLKQNPAATTVVETQILQTMPRSIAIDEAMKLVPGVKVDNQAGGERVHLSIRGQGILTERGTRGVKTLVDGVPLNDPSGFVSDFFDIDWATVSRIEVLRGPAAAFYGSGSSGGILNILTRDGGPDPISGAGFLTGGSYGFFKGLAEAGGTTGSMNYRLSGSGLSGQGYRDHTKYRADNFYGKFKINVSPSLKLTAILGWTDFFNENAEGLNIAWFSANPGKERRLANPDAYKYNEYQKTSRFSIGIVGTADLDGNTDLAFNAYFRKTKYKESVPSSLIHRGYDLPGLSLQVNHHAGEGRLKNHLSVGADLGRQNINEYKKPNLGNAVEGPDKISDQTYSQSGAGVFVLDRVDLGQRWGVSLSLRYDKVTNKLDDILKAGGLDFSGDRSFNKATGRIGLTYNPLSSFGLYASWGTGFLPPGTEELVNNPYAFSGFNMNLVPATSRGEEIGARGSIGDSFVYDLALFHLATKDDFGRYRVTWRPLETFYGNVGKSNRYGLETYLAWFPVESLALRLAYTYSRFKYDRIETFEAGALYKGTWLPNSPEHQAYLDAEYKFTPRIYAGASLEVMSRWFIDGTNKSSVDGYQLLHVRLGYKFGIGGMPWELILSGRNIFGKQYIAFTEPDPDGNSYQPAPTAEWSIGLRLGLGGKN